MSVCPYVCCVRSSVLVAYQHQTLTKNLLIWPAQLVNYW